MYPDIGGRPTGRIGFSEQHRNGTYTPAEGDTRFQPAADLVHPRQLEEGNPRRAGKIFNGGALSPIVDELKRIHKQVLRGRVWVALHMHAGDGNVHTNIPVNSDNYEMLQTAHEAVARIMKLARSLDGVISGEHGIGITKLEFLSDDEIRQLHGLQAKVDPEGRFNKGASCCAALPSKTLGDDVHAADLTEAYTPSFGLMGHESLIMQQSDIGDIAASVKDCLRCGKCKPVLPPTCHAPTCSTAPQQDLATSLLVEAFLYEERRLVAVCRSSTGKSSKTWPTIARFATSA